MKEGEEGIDFWRHREVGGVLWGGVLNINTGIDMKRLLASFSVYLRGSTWQCVYVSFESLNVQPVCTIWFVVVFIFLIFATWESTYLIIRSKNNNCYIYTQYVHIVSGKYNTFWVFHLVFIHMVLLDRRYLCSWSDWSYGLFHPIIWKMCLYFVDLRFVFGVMSGWW